MIFINGLLLLVSAINLAVLVADSSTFEVSSIVDGVEFKVPYYEPGEVPSSREVRDFYQDIALRAHVIAQWLVDAAINERLDDIDALGISKIADLLDLRTYCKKFAEEHNLRDDPQFRLDMLEILDGLTNRKYIKKSSVLDCCFKLRRDRKSLANNEKLLLKLGLILNGAYRLAVSSPVGLHLDYRRMTIDGRLATDDLCQILEYIYEAEYTIERHRIVLEFIDVVHKSFDSRFKREIKYKL